MDNAKVERTIVENANTNRLFGQLAAWVNPKRFYGLQFKLIFPYVILALVLAAVGVFIITRLVVDSEMERFNNNLLDAHGVASDGIVQNERLQLEKLRFLVFANGMAQAVYEKDAARVEELILPILANSSLDLMTALDSSGQEMVTLVRDPATGVYRKQQGHNYASLPIVQKVLANKKDTLGDKFVDIVRTNDGRAILFTSAALRDANDNLAGVMMVGSYLDTILRELKDQALSEIILLDDQGRLIATTLTQKEEGFQTLIDLAAARLLNNNDTELYDLQLNEREHRVAYGPFIVREESVGQLGVVKDSQYLVSKAATSRNLFIGLFAAGTIVMVVIGYLLSQDIVRPLLKLRDLSQAVAQGDLDQHIGLARSDEIGDLGNAFDTMTRHLQERTEEAARLLAETIQRNKELKEINAKLEAMQLQLIQSEKLASIGQLTAGIVHDVKNPFAVIMGMAEVLAEDENLDEATRHGLNVMRESAIKGNTIVSDLLKFARQSKPEMRTMDLRETVETSLRLTAYLTRKYNLSVELPERPLIVTYDAQQIEQVLINMIHNAIQAMPDKGSLTIALRQADGTARISIQDTGCGISPEHMKRIFDPFFTTKPEGQGTGLGLSVSYGIIANHNGRIDVESEVGKGTTFTIVLPISQPSLTTGENDT